MQVPALLDRAKKHTGSDSLTARALGVSAQRVSDWRHGTRPMPAEVQDKACALACLSDAEIAAHVFERAGVTRPRWTSVASVAGFVGSLGTGVALFVAHFGSATMYRPNLRRAKREQSCDCQMQMS